MGNNFTTTYASVTGGESTLSETRATIKEALGRYLGVSRDPEEWDPDTQSDVSAIIKSGERNFYQPLKQEGERSVHVWSFLNPIMELVIEGDVADYELPGDFGGAFIDPVLKWAPADDQVYDVVLTSVMNILDLRQNDNLSPSTFPTHAAVQPLASNQEDGQRFQIMLWPSPGSDGTLLGQYYSNPFAIADDTPYPLGGQPHAECLLESCLAAAELHMNDERGNHRAQFERLLTSAIALDRKLSTPKFFGYNADRSSNAVSDLLETRLRHSVGVITFNGV